MQNIRLIYEQIEAAKEHLAGGDVLDWRLALILLDNVAELLMARELKDAFDFEDYFYPMEGRARLDDRLRSRCTAKERRRAEREFEGKLRILCFRMGKVSPEERSILKVCHRLRCEAFHIGKLRRTILSQAVVLLFETTVRLTVSLPARGFSLPSPTPAGADAAFLERFGLGDAMLLALDEGRQQLAQKLLEGVPLPVGRFSETLSQDLLKRIDEGIVGGLAYLGDRDADLDRNLQYGQFWQDRGISLAEAGMRLPRLDEEFERWRAQKRAKYTMAKINQWRRQAELIARRDSAAVALEQWWAIDEKMQPLEAGIERAVAEFDNQINTAIHDRRRLIHLQRFPDGTR